MYRQQFVYGMDGDRCEELRCTYSFDGSNVPSFSATIAGGALLQGIPLILDKDADYLIRGIQIQATQLLIGLFDSGGHPLQLPVAGGIPPTLSVPLWAQCDGGPITALESDNWGIYCRAGARLLVNVQNTTAGPLAGPIITLHGTKRFKGIQCQ